MTPATETVAASRRARAVRDGGFSLVELAVYVALFGIVAALVSAVVIASFQAERTVSGTTTMANDAQAVIANLDRDIRNARSVLPESGSVTTITLCVAGAADDLTWHPTVWSFDGGSLTRASDGAPATAVLTGLTPGSGSFVVSGATVEYTFALRDDGTAEREFQSATALSAARSEEECA